MEDYARSIQSAWEIVEHLVKNGNYVNLAIAPKDDDPETYRCEIVWADGLPIEELAPTAPRAICEAFLKLPLTNEAKT